MFDELYSSPEMGLYRASHVKIRQNTHKIHSSNPCTIWLNFISFHFISFHCSGESSRKRAQEACWRPAGYPGEPDEDREGEAEGEEEDGEEE